MGPALCELAVGDDPGAWMAAGFVLDDGGAVVLGGTRLRLEGTAAGRGLLGWSLRRPADLPAGEPPALVDGLPTRWLDATIGSGPAPHPNGITGVDHVVLASPDIDRTTEALAGVGFEARRTRDTVIGGQPGRQRFFWAGDVIVELVGPAEPAGEGPATFFGLALVADDLDETARWLGPALGPVRPAVQAGRRIATLRGRDLGLSVAVAVMSPH